MLAQLENVNTIRRKSDAAWLVCGLLLSDRQCLEGRDRAFKFLPFPGEGSDHSEANDDRAPRFLTTYLPNWTAAFAEEGEGEKKARGYFAAGLGCRYRPRYSSVAWNSVSHEA